MDASSVYSGRELYVIISKINCLQADLQAVKDMFSFYIFTSLFSFSLAGILNVTGMLGVFS